MRRFLLKLFLQFFIGKNLVDIQDEEFIIILDIDKIFSEEEIEVVRSSGEKALE